MVGRVLEPGLMGQSQVLDVVSSWGVEDLSPRQPPAPAAFSHSSFLWPTWYHCCIVVELVQGTSGKAHTLPTSASCVHLASLRHFCAVI